MKHFMLSYRLCTSTWKKMPEQRKSECWSWHIVGLCDCVKSAGTFYLSTEWHHNGDILIYSCSFHEQASDLTKVLDNLRQNNLTAKPSKTENEILANSYFLDIKWEVASLSQITVTCQRYWTLKLPLENAKSDKYWVWWSTVTSSLSATQN